MLVICSSIAHYLERFAFPADDWQGSSSHHMLSLGSQLRIIVAIIMISNSHWLRCFVRMLVTPCLEEVIRGTMLVWSVILTVQLSALCCFEKRHRRLSDYLLELHLRLTVYLIILTLAVLRGVVVASARIETHSWHSEPASECFLHTLHVLLVALRSFLLFILRLNLSYKESLFVYFFTYIIEFLLHMRIWACL